MARKPAVRKPRKVVRKAARQAPRAAKAVSKPKPRLAPTKGKLPTGRGRGRRPPPYVRLIERAGSVRVWLVDGSYVRKNIDEEFTNFGHHFSISAIPRDEIWLDIEQVPDEQQFFVRHALIERRLMARGMDYEAARTVAIAEERKMRLKDGDMRRIANGENLADVLHEALGNEGRE